MIGLNFEFESGKGWEVSHGMGSEWISDLMLRKEEVDTAVSNMVDTVRLSARRSQLSRLGLISEDSKNIQPENKYS